MACKMLLFLALAALVSQGNSLTEIRLEDKNLTYLTNQLIGKTMTIPKFWFDTLQVCLLTMPNGITYEAYPNSNLPNTIQFLQTVEPFTSCGISMIGVGVEMSGTYELHSLLLHQDNSQSLTRQRYNLTVKEIED